MITLADNTATDGTTGRTDIPVCPLGPPDYGTGVPARGDLTVSALFSRLFPAVAFVTRDENIPERVQTEATLAAVKVVQDFKAGQLQETLERRARIKMRS